MGQLPIDTLIHREYDFFLGEKEEWSLASRPQDLELVSHAMRVLLHIEKASDFVEEYEALVACQNLDGGWAPLSRDGQSTVWVSAFCSLMLLRANRLLHREPFNEAVASAIDYFLESQRADGRWVDPAWADLDTTSHPVSFFNVTMALQHRYRNAEVQKSWRKGIRFIIESQDSDGGWYDNEFHPSGVEITAHLIQDALVADLVMDNGVSGVREACSKGAKRLCEWQSEAGSWDDENVDHTMDCTRSLMLVTRILNEPGHRASIDRGIKWIVHHKNRRGWGDFPGMETNLERTCDGIDTLLKYKAFCQADAKQVIRLWGYLP